MNKLDWDSLFLRCSRTPALSSVPSPATRRPVSLVFLMAMVAFMPLRSGISSVVLPSAIDPLLCSMDHLLDHLLKQEEYKGPNVSFSSLQSHWRIDDPRRLRDGLQEGLPQVRWPHLQRSGTFPLRSPIAVPSLTPLLYSSPTVLTTVVPPPSPLLWPPLTSFVQILVWIAAVVE